MKKAASVIIIVMAGLIVKAQNTEEDSLSIGKITVIKDPRLEILAKKEAEFSKNRSSGIGAKASRGYRLFIIKSDDREKVMKIRARLLQSFPDQRPYMTFQAPFIKLRFGDFLEKDDAEKYKNLIMRSGIVTNNVYVVPEIVEVKHGKIKEAD